MNNGRGLRESIDLGFGITAVPFGWRPGREVEAPVSNMGISGVVLEHKNEKGMLCKCSVNFDSDTFRRISPLTPKNRVISLSPLTLGDAIRCFSCGLRGYITDGRWEFE